LSPDKVFTLLSQDHAHKTVTVESFPHLSTNWASVHPCKHAAVMKKIIDQYSTADKEIRVDQYLVIFLKFMSSIMPSVDYDHTIAME
jgi:ubiquitin-like-conjugating enzyme ATG3